MYKLSHNETGLRCTEAGLTYDGVKLVAKATNGRFEPKQDWAIAKRAYHIRPSSLQAVANFLNKGDLGLAEIAALHLMPFLEKANFDPSQPRDDHGMWTSEGSGDDEPVASSPPAVSPHEDEPVDAERGLPPGYELASDATNASGATGYKPTSELPKDAVSYTAGDGTQFYAPPKANFDQVYEYGKTLDYTPYGVDGLDIERAATQGGLFDYQRSNGVLYHQYTSASNYGVGVLMNAAGYSLTATKLIASAFAYTMSSNAGKPDQQDWWTRGWNDAEAGRWK